MSDDDSDEEIYRITSQKTIFRRRSRSREGRRSKAVYQSSALGDRPSTTYFPVTKWAVDYNNRNYVRSKCNKNKGLHRRIRGRPLDWHVEYDNNYFTRSKVNPLKGYHRRIPEIQRKYAPDDDELADATGWEFDCGPEWDQLEQDVVYIPEGRITARGCYRWYGTRRSGCDHDSSDEETRENLLTEDLERELRHTDEFLQADRQHLVDAKNQRYTRGGYRFYETMRNAYDILPEDFEDPEWRRKHHCNGYRYLDLDAAGTDEEDATDRKKRGKPFRRTVLNKVYELKKRDDSPDSRRYRTRLSLRPGEGEQTLYHGVPDRYRFAEKKPISAKDAFKRPGRVPQRYETDYEDYQSGEPELKAPYAARMKKMAADKRRRSSYEDVSSLDRAEQSYRMQSKVTSRKSAEDVGQGNVRGNFDTWRETATRGKMKRKSGDTYYLEEKSPRESRTGQPMSQRQEVPRPRMKKPPAGSRYSNYDYDTEMRQPTSSRGVGKQHQTEHRAASTERREVKSEEPPPHIKKRIKDIHEKVDRELGLLDSSKFSDKGHLRQSMNTDKVDLSEHSKHPQDRGHSHRSESEEYSITDGDETWIRKEEDVTEIHHKRSGEKH